MFLLLFQLIFLSYSNIVSDPSISNTLPNFQETESQQTQELQETQNIQQNSTIQENYCEYVDCNKQSSCHQCSFYNECCIYNLEDKICQIQNNQKFNQSELEDIKKKAQIKNITEYPDPQMNVTFPKCDIFEEVPLYNATNYLFKNHDICGIPSYCPKKSYVISSEEKIQFDQGINNIGRGELCTIYFEGRMGPDFIIQIGMESISKHTYTAGLTICLSVGMFDQFPCIDFFQPIKLQKNIYYRIRANQFRITLQFNEDSRIDTSKLFIYIISQQKLNQQYQQQLFQFVIILLLTILGSIVLIALLRAILIRIFGRRILYWIDPEPLIPRRRYFNVQNEFQKLKDTSLIKNIQINEIKYEQEKCAFCLEIFENNQIIEIFCGHCFHEKCFIAHMETKKQIGRCSICNIEISITKFEQFKNQQNIEIQNQERIHVSKLNEEKENELVAINSQKEQ